MDAPGGPRLIITTVALGVQAVWGYCMPIQQE